jgi:hypothetical protein
MTVSLRLPMGKPGKGSVFTVRLPGSADKNGAETVQIAAVRMSAFGVKRT